MDKAKFIKNPDPDAYDKICKEIEENGGYCPCVLSRTDDDICECLTYRETGVCICEKYVE